MIMTILKRKIGDNLIVWVDLIPKVRWAYRIMVHTHLGIP